MNYETNTEDEYGATPLSSADINLDKI